MGVVALMLLKLYGVALTSGQAGAVPSESRCPNHAVSMGFPLVSEMKPRACWPQAGPLNMRLAPA